MKASLNCREEKSPVLRVKYPLSLWGFPLISGISIGDSSDLVLFLSTSFDAGPSLKVSYWPALASCPLFVSLKTGIGAWGSPNGAVLNIVAEIKLARNGGPSFALHIKPRVGDFSLRKQTKSVTPCRPHSSARLDPAECRGVDATITRTPLHLEASSLFTPAPIRHTFHKHPLVDGTANSWDGEGRADFWQNEGFEQVRSRNPCFESCNGHEPEFRSPTPSSVDFESSMSEPKIREMPFANSTWHSGPNGCLRGWGLHVHSSLPVGQQARLNMRWGLQLYPDSTQWQWNKLGIRLPYLHFQKISLLELGQFPSKPEEVHELSHVAALCGSMKPQLHLLYAENEVLRKAMEDMKSQFEQHGSVKSWKPVGAPSKVIGEHGIPTDSKLLELAQGSKETLNVNRTAKGNKDSVGKDQHENSLTVSDRLSCTVDGPNKGGLATDRSIGKRQISNSMLD